MEAFFWVMDSVLPTTLVLVGLWNKRKIQSGMLAAQCADAPPEVKEDSERAHRLASRLLILWGGILAGFVILMKLIVPLQPHYLSLIINFVSISVFIVIIFFVNYKRTDK